MAENPLERDIPLRYVLSHFIYERETGKLFWRPREEESAVEKWWNTRFAGKEIRNFNSKGKLQVHLTIDGVKYSASLHRIIFAFENGRWPSDQIDHIGREGSANRITDLRECDQSRNKANSGLYSNNSTGFKGVTRRNGKYVAQIGFKGNVLRLGTFSDPKQAARTYDAKAVELFGEFATTNAMLGLL